MANCSLKIIAIGNDFYGDDGVGCALLNRLEKSQEFDKIPLIDGATDALGLIDHFCNAKHVIIIDAAKMGLKPGTVKIFDGKDVNTHIFSDHFSVHGLSLVDTFALAEMVDSLPEKITVVGIEPKHLQIARGLSQPVQQSIDQAVDNIRNLCHEQLHWETS